MGKRRSGSRAVAVIAAFTFIMAGAAAAEDIYLPFDWFYGRWVDGHQPEMDFVWQEHVKPAREGSYSFTSGNVMFGAYDIRGELVSYDGEGHLEFPTLFLRVRPKSNWQLSIDGMTFDAVDDNSEDLGSVGTFWRREFEMILSSHWLNRNGIAVEQAHAAHSYLISPIPSSGTVQLDNEVGYSQRSYRHSGLSADADQGQAGFSDGAGSEYSLESRTTLNWRCAEWLLTRAWMYTQADEGSSVYGTGGWSGQSDTEMHSDSYKAEHANVSYYVEARLLNLAPVYGAISLAQEFQEDEYLSHRIGTYLSDEFEIRRQYQHDLLAEVQTTYSFDVHYIGTGEFDPRVVRDDYPHCVIRTLWPGLAAERQALPGFYGRMMARRQLWVHSKFSHGSRNFFEDDDQRTLTHRLEVRYGLSGKIECALDWSYEHNTYPYSNSLFSPYRYSYSVVSAATVGLRLRSFEYQPGAGPGWDRDTPDDIAMGPLLSAGMWQAECIWRPPILSRTSNDRISFGTLTGLQNEHQSEVSLSFEVGLGHGFELGLFDDALLLPVAVGWHEFGGTATARIGGRLQMVCAYEQIGSRDYRWSIEGQEWHVYGPWEHSDPVFSLNIRALL